MPKGEATPEEMVNVELAERFGISPLEVKYWSAYEKNWVLKTVEAKIAGLEYRRKLDEFKNKGKK